jgi:hypothetical protein
LDRDKAWHGLCGPLKADHVGADPGKVRRVFGVHRAGLLIGAEKGPARTVEPADATYTAIEWAVKNAGGTGVTGIVDGKFTPTGTGDLVLTATIADGSAIGTPFTHDYTITIYGSGEFKPEFGFGEDTSILLRGSAAGQELLSKDTVIEIAKGSVYYVSLITGSGGSYTDVVWRLNGTKQNISGSGSMIHLDTSTARTFKLSVIGTRNGLGEGSGTYTFKIVDSE